MTSSMMKTRRSISRVKLRTFLAMTNQGKFDNHFLSFHEAFESF